jgi:hypothetical protein
MYFRLSNICSAVFPLQKCPSIFLNQDAQKCKGILMACSLLHLHVKVGHKRTLPDS